MESVIHQSLGYIFHFDASAFPIAQIENAFVGDETAFAFEQDRKITIQSFCDVICIQDRALPWRVSVPPGPIMRMYIQEMVRMLALP